MLRHPEPPTLRLVTTDSHPETEEPRREMHEVYGKSSNIPSYQETPRWHVRSTRVFGPNSALLMAGNLVAGFEMRREQAEGDIHMEHNVLDRVLAGVFRSPHPPSGIPGGHREYTKWMAGQSGRFVLCRSPGKPTYSTGRPCRRQCLAPARPPMRAGWLPVGANRPDRVYIYGLRYY